MEEDKGRYIIKIVRLTNQKQNQKERNVHIHIYNGDR